LALKL